MCKQVNYFELRRSRQVIQHFRQNKMIVLASSSLNKRHQELNKKVNEANRNNLNFDEIKDASGKSDVDKLFKIDLASKYRNINYILNVLTSGDSLYISRALKCDWITDDEFTEFMNPKYLERNIFPCMFPKMKRRLLSTLSARIRNGKRAEEFHHYCMRNRMHNLGMNFLLYTNESFKIKMLTLHPHVYNNFDRNENYLEHFIGNSFLLAESYLKVFSDSTRPRVIFKLRYLYWISGFQYLDLLETFTCTDKNYFHITSLRLSRDIMEKRKKRVLRDPWLYLNTLHHEVVAKYSTSEDAKVYAIPFLPDNCDSFWQRKYWNENAYFLNLIPLGERFSFIKKIFSEKYPGELFEENINFYAYKCYEIMTVKEKEDWALRHVDSTAEMDGYDHIWYQFINFEKSFAVLKKYTLTAPNNFKKSSILNTLIVSAKTQEEITILLEYYNSKHINELNEYKEYFINDVIYNHKVLHFNDKCWAALVKIFNNLGVYDDPNENKNKNTNRYQELSLIYHIIHEKQIADFFYKNVISRNITISKTTIKRFACDLDQKNLDLIFQYMLSCFTDHVESLMKISTQENLEQMHTFINDILDLIVTFNKTFEDIPQFIVDYIMNEDKFELFKNHQLFAMFRKPPSTDNKDIMNNYKSDSWLVVSKFSIVERISKIKIEE